MVVEAGRRGQLVGREANAGGTSETAREAYSDGMSLRPITGCAVLVVLLASVALPTMCGACVDFAAGACGEKHDAGTGRQLSMAMSGHCADCGEQPGITANGRWRHVGASEVMFLDCARRICVQAGEQSAAIYLDRGDARRMTGDQATFGGSAGILFAAVRVAHLNVFGSVKSLGNSAYQPLSVSLKI